MNRAKVLVVFVILILATVAVVMSGCSSVQNPGSTNMPTASLVKPNPTVESINAATSGMGDNYYAILNITIRNEGAAGTVMLAGTVTQGTQNIENSLPVYINQKTTQTVTLVFKLKWQGADWTPKVEVKVP
jgi:hypothetical protein